MAELTDFLSALFGACADPIRLLVGEEAFDAATGDEIANVVAYAGDTPIYVSPVTSEGNIPFLFTALPNANIDEWRDFTVVPTAVLFKADEPGADLGTMLCMWSLEEAAHIDQPEAFALASDMAEVPEDASFEDEAIPAPGSDWELLHCDGEQFQPLAVLIEAYGASQPEPAVAEGDTPPWEEAPTALGTFNDATILAPFDPTDPILEQPFKFAVGGNRLSKDWKTQQNATLGMFLGLMTLHKKAPKKDGLGVVLGEIVGTQRTKSAVKALYGVGLDIDVGVPGVDIDLALSKLGVMAVRYSTHSHSKATTKITKDTIAKKYGGVVNEENIRHYLRNEKRWVQAMVDTVEYVTDEHEAEGLMAVLSHDAMPKCRVILPFAEPFYPASAADTHAAGMAMWNKVPPAVSRLLGLELAFDRAAVDPSRLFYTPRHAEGKPFEAVIFGGPLLDWKTLDLDAAASKDDFTAALEAELALNSNGTSKGKSTTREGQDLGRWSIKAAGGFQIVDVIRDHAEDRIRTNGSTKIDIECPFDEDHSNPGDPEDRGCFAVNAGDGQSEIFTIRCAHDSCAGRTNLDHLGKMIKDGWFAEAVLEDESYNAAAPEGAEPSPLAEKIAREDDARQEYEKLIDALKPDSPDREVEAALAAVIDANLGKLATTRVQAKIKQQLKINQSTLASIMKSISKEVEKERNQTGAVKDPKGRLVFSFQGGYHFDEAEDICFKALLDTNRKDAEPTFSCVQDKPVRLTRNPKNGRISFDELSNRTLWSELNKKVTFMRRNDQGDGDRDPVPKEVADQVYEQAYTALPQSPEIIYTPLFTEGGHLIVEPGYYPDLNLLMADTGFKVDLPRDPTAEEALAAVNFLKDELLIDFPFLDYDSNGVEQRGPSEANALAMLLTPFMRRMINGCTPVFFVAKPTPGTGGTLLGKVPMLIFDGQESAPMRYTQNEEEMQKALLAAIIETRSHLFFDDVKDFNNRSLLQSITAQEIGGRLLGSTRNVSRPNTFNWIGTGNNPLIGSEMERRICWVRLNRKVANIQEIVYTHDDLPGWIAENRAKIIGAILTMIDYWLSTGGVTFEARKRVSFEDWSRKVGGVLQACGVEGFLDNRRSAGADMDETAIRTFIKEWIKKFNFEPVTTSKLYEYATFQELDIIEGNNDDQKKQRFPKKLHTLEGRVFTIEKIDYLVETGFDEDQNLVYRLTALNMLAEDDEPIAA